MPAALVQKKASLEVLNSTTITATFDSGVTITNLIVGVVASWVNGGTTLTSIADNKGNGNYTIQENDLWNSNVRHAQGYKSNVGTGGTSFVITATFPVAVGGTLGIFEYSGIEATPTVVNASNSGTGTVVTAGTVNPAVSSLIIAGMIHDGAATITENHASYTEQLEIDEDNSSQCQNIADRLTTTGSQACTWSLSASSPWGAHSVGYSETAGGGGGAVRVPLTLLGVGT